MNKKALAIIIALITVIIYLAISVTEIERLRSRNEVLSNNQEVLLLENNTLRVERQKYKVADSLNALKVYELRLTLDEYKQYREEDQRLIAKLKIDKSALQQVINTQAATITSLNAELKDTLDSSGVIIDSIKVFNYESTWTDVKGVINTESDSVSLVIHNRESLMIVESVEYKRFLGFLWKTKQIKKREIDVLSKNPNTEIVGASFERIEE